MTITLAGKTESYQYKHNRIKFDTYTSGVCTITMSGKSASLNDAIGSLEYTGKSKLEWR